MHLRELLPREHIVVPLEAATFREALAVLADRLAQAGAVEDPARLEEVLGQARLRDVVVVGERVALPHYRTDAVSRPVVALGVAPHPLDARASGLDAAPEIVVLIIAPPEAATLYLRTVSAIMRLFRVPGALDHIAQARSPDEVLALPEVSELRIQPRLSVRDIMVHQVERVSPGDPVRKALDIMIRRRVRAVPVVGDKEEVLGIVTDRDIMRALLQHIPRAGEEPEAEMATAPSRLTVREVMSRSVLCISEDTGVDEAASMLINKTVEHLPVVSEGKLTGFLTRGDIIRKLFAR